MPAKEASWLQCESALLKKTQHTLFSNSVTGTLQEILAFFFFCWNANRQQQLV